MIEAMAKAIYLWDCDIDHFPVEWSEVPEQRKNKHRQQAMAAIEALREPTAQMLTAGRKAPIPYYAEANAKIAITWREMIDAAKGDNTRPSPENGQ